jgi:hypothetical protein
MRVWDVAPSRATWEVNMMVFVRCVLAAMLSTAVLALTVDVAAAQKKRAVRVPPGACKVSSGYIPTGQACSTAPNQFNMSQMNWCSFGTLTPGIYCAGMVCPSIRC